MRGNTATPEMRPMRPRPASILYHGARAPKGWGLYIHSGADRRGAYGGGLFTCRGRDLWQADDGWMHRAGTFEKPTLPNEPHPAPGSLWKVTELARETGSITFLRMRPATPDELPQLREYAAWDRRRHVSVEAWHAIPADYYPAKHAARLASRAIEMEHMDWLPKWQRDCLLQTLAEEAAIPPGIPEPIEWSLYTDCVDRQEAYGGGLYRCMGRREWRADAGWTHWDTPTPPDASHPAPGSLWMVSGMKETDDTRTVVQLRPASPSDAARIREKASHHE